MKSLNLLRSFCLSVDSSSIFGPGEHNVLCGSFVSIFMLSSSGTRYKRRAVADLNSLLDAIAEEDRGGYRTYEIALEMNIVIELRNGGYPCTRPRGYGTLEATQRATAAPTMMPVISVRTAGNIPPDVKVTTYIARSTIEKESLRGCSELSAELMTLSTNHSGSPPTRT
ncbi:hypothetical protein PAXINDRAFT_15057 [Paxillus involutus ATCC 200175]|uniref:Uncharacterized protein n=1 Tax=Paxillus involutus ATCC 200175 TaxID=664439 RepID=A0A0C9TNS0_PAXIN|nr:hypothetical protein PAXINDRAFT_15057 [Paxillus involutus ATCC 200175]